MTYSKPSPELCELSHRRPPCFSPAQWNDWKMAGVQAKPPKLDTYCADCTAEYKARMEQQQKCIWPDVVFRKDADGFLSGVRPSMRCQPSAMRLEPVV